MSIALIESFNKHMNTIYEYDIFVHTSFFPNPFMIFKVTPSFYNDCEITRGEDRPTFTVSIGLFGFSPELFFLI